MSASDDSSRAPSPSSLGSLEADFDEALKKKEGQELTSEAQAMIRETEAEVEAQAKKFDELCESSAFPFNPVTLDDSCVDEGGEPSKITREDQKDSDQEECPLDLEMLGAVGGEPAKSPKKVVIPPAVGVVPENPPRKKKHTKKAPEFEKVSLAEKIETINSRGGEGSQAYYKMGSQGHLGRRHDGKYLISENFIGKGKEIEGMNAEDVTNLHKMWVDDAWGALVDPPAGLKLSHFIAALPKEMDVLECHKKTITAHFNLLWSKVRGEHSTSRDISALAKYYEEKGAIISANEQTIPAALEKFTKLSMSMYKHILELYNDMGAVNKMIAEECSRGIKVSSGAERGSTTKLAQAVELVNKTMGKVDEKTGDIMKKQPTMLELAKEDIMSLSDLSGVSHKRGKKDNDSDEECVEY